MGSPLASWRLLVEPNPRPGALNMAIDEAVLRAVVAGQVPSTLRLYGWTPPALTLGRGQPYADADVVALRRDGVDLVRRMTGGTAVLNRHELTYAVCVSDRDFRLAGSIAESYHDISRALLLALESLGLAEARAESQVVRVTGQGAPSSLTPTTRSRSRERTPVCFAIPSDYEITVGSRKLVGSAQMRVRGGILQHGSLPLDGDLGAISTYLASRPAPDGVRSLALTLADALGRTASWEEVAEAMVAGFGAALNVTLVPGSLTPGELAQADGLVAEKYGNQAWTARV